MAVYVALNWLACIATAMILGVSLWRDRSLLIRPSIFVVLFFHASIQWAAAADAEVIYGFLPDPWAFFLLAQAFPLVGLLVPLSTGRRQQRVLWQRIVCPAATFRRYRRRVSLVLAACIAIVAAYYFATVPVSQTGLYAMLFDPACSAIAREDSLKLLSDPLLKYAFSFMTSAFAPMLAVLLTEQVAENARPLRLRRVLPAVVGIALVMIVVSPTGAREFPASIVLAVLLSRSLRKGLPLSPSQILLGILAVLALPTLMSLLREGRQLDWPAFWDVLQGGIFRRVFHTPMETGTWYVHYAQTSGFVGVRGIPRLASLWALEPLEMPNLVGLLYAVNPLRTINANTCYVFSYYSYFGLLSLPFSLLALWLLDSAFWVYRRINDDLLLPCVATVCKASMAFVSSDYTLVFLSNGWAVTLILALLLDRIVWTQRADRLKAGEVPHLRQHVHLATQDHGNPAG